MAIIVRSTGKIPAKLRAQLRREYGAALGREVKFIEDSNFDAYSVTKLANANAISKARREKMELRMFLEAI